MCIKVVSKPRPIERLYFRVEDGVLKCGTGKVSWQEPNTEDRRSIIARVRDASRQLTKVGVSC